MLRIEIERPHVVRQISSASWCRMGQACGTTLSLPDGIEWVIIAEQNELSWLDRISLCGELE
jgi:hypothetical protein